jgi:hypothetical protein
MTATVTEPNDESWIYAHAAAGGLVSATDAAGNSTVVGSDA